MLKYFPRLALALALLAGGAALILALGLPVRGAPPTGGTPIPQWGVDIRVNSTATTYFDQQRNLSMAVDSVNPELVIASYDSQDPGLTNSGVSTSTDGGQTWSGRRFYGTWISGTDSIPFGNTTVAFDSHGVAYYSNLVSGGAMSGYFVLTSTNGLAWSTPVPVVVSDYSQYRDQGHLAVDPRTSGPFAGSLYMAWRFNDLNYHQGIIFRYSRDRGLTWSGDIFISDSSHVTCAQPALAVARDGTVYVAFADAPVPHLQQPVRLYLHRSTDGGQTWGPEQLITGAPITKIGSPDTKGHDMILLGDQYNNALIVTSPPFLAVSPNDPNTVYVAWNDGRWESTFTYFGNTGAHSDIAFSRSTDAGATWSAPLRVNDDPMGNGVDQFLPTLSVGPDGRLGLSWYDRREDTLGFLYDTYYSQSTDGGTTWSANQRVSDVSSDPMAMLNPKGAGYLGDYSALAFGPNYVLPSWIDTRDGANQDVYTDRGTFAVLPSPTASATASVTPSATPSATPSPPACALSFVDVPPAAYYAPAASWLACQGIVAGYQCGGPGEPCPGPYYRPVAPSTRGQLSKMVALGLGWPLTTPLVPTFVDVPPSQPFYPYIETAVAHGVLSGYDCGGAGEPCPGRYFRPSANVTRGQLSKIIVNAKGWGGYSPPGPSFGDVPPSSPFYGYIERAVQRGLLSGYDCGGLGEPCPGRYFRPGNDATRAQLSKILYNALIQP